MITRKNRKRTNRIAATLLSAVLVVTSCLTVPQAAQSAEAERAVDLLNPRVEVNTCETVYFGNYWQEDTNGDGKADQKDDKTPIRWRILSRNGDDAYVIADKVLDCKPYNEEDIDITWETSTLRTWLNGEFLNSAFTAEEQAVIEEQTLVNADNEEYDTEGGNDTKDKVYLPSFADMKNTAYGFSEDWDFRDQAGLGKATAYAKEQGVYTGGEMGNWWLCSQGFDAYCAMSVDSDGRVDMSGQDVSRSNVGVRPALLLNLSSHLVKQEEVVQTSFKSVSWDLVELGTYNGKPIVWRVLKADGDDVYLLSEKVLEKRKYNEEYKNVTWKESTLRNWLNGKFYEAAFSETEKAGIKKYTYENKDNPWRGTEGGENTEDYVTLLSLEDMVNQEYGFPMDYECEHRARAARDQNGEGSGWWLRSPGVVSDIVTKACVFTSGYVDVLGEFDVDYSNGVRPALHFNLSSSSLKKVGTVNSDKTVTGGDNPGECTEHSPETDVAVTASCEKEGKTEGSHCSICGTVLTEQETIPATGHKWDAGTVTKQATAAEDGEKTFTCTVCGKTKTETIDATGTTGQDKPGTTKPSVPSAPGGQTDTTVKVQSVKLSGETKKLAAGRKIQLSATVTPGNASDKSLVWESSNTKYATVDSNGKVTAKAKGAGKTVTITATAGDGSNVKASYRITIMKDAVKSVKLNKPPKSVKAGKTIKLKAVVKTTGKKANKTLQWESSNTKYATVTNKGVVKTKKAGKGKKLKITVMSTDGSNKKASVTLKLK